jgi:hypothetical protein
VTPSLQPTGTPSTADASLRVPAAGLYLPSPVSAPVDDDLFQIREDYRVNIPGHILTILTGYVTDFASIPRIFWASCGYPSEPELQSPTLIHDAMYSGELVTRKEADDILYWALRANGVSAYRAWKIWAGVRIGGGFVWRRHTPDSITTARLYCSLSHH